MAAKTLDGRLLCAAACAYEHVNPYKDGAGYHKEPHRLTRGVNSCLLGKTKDGIVVAFRGTDKGAQDWLQNVAVSLIEEKSLSPEGKIHSGYYQAMQGMKEDIKRILLDLVKTKFRYKPRVYLTGHSKGGCLASLYALELTQDTDLPNPTYVCTFGTPRAGDHAFAEQYNQTIRQTTYENHLDIVPFLPPGSNDRMAIFLKNREGDVETRSACCNAKQEKKFWKYAPIGSRKYIDSRGEIVHNVTSELDTKRIREIEQKTIVRASEFRRAHSSGCPDPTSDCSGGYFKTIAPEICSQGMASN